MRVFRLGAATANMRATQRRRLLATVVLLLLLLYIVIKRRSIAQSVEASTIHPQLYDVQHVYIASALWNAGALLEADWVPTLLNVVETLKSQGVQVYVSIYESGSWDGTKDALRRLDSQLEIQEVARTIKLEDISHKESIAQWRSRAGWLETRYGKELRRVSHLAEIRNRVMEPLRAQNKTFDRILWLNDVYFSVQSPIFLLIIVLMFRPGTSLIFWLLEMEIMLQPVLSTSKTPLGIRLTPSSMGHTLPAFTIIWRLETHRDTRSGLTYFLILDQQTLETL